MSYPNETLVRNGFLGASPEKPTLTISIELLEIYRQLCRVCPRFSLDALGRALCHIHQVNPTLLFYCGCNVVMSFHRFLVAHTSLTRSALHMIVFLKFNATLESGSMAHLDERKGGSRKMFARRVCTKWLMSRHSSSVFWRPWMATIPSNWSTALSAQDPNDLITEKVVPSDGFLLKMLMCSRTK